MVRRWCLYLAMVLGCLLLMIFYQGWLGWILLLAVLGTPVFSLAVSLPAMLRFRVKVAPVGAVEVHAPVNVELQTECPLPMPQFRSKIRVEHTLTAQNRVLCQGEPLPTGHCGQLLCRAEKCYVYDYLMLFFVKVRFQEGASVVVLPKPIQMDVPEQMERQMARSWKPKAGGGFAENHEVRLFRPGDSMNQVHWKLTAKTGKWMTREAMEPVSRNLQLVLEIQGNAQQLDIKLGKLLWLGQYLLDRAMPFEILALAGTGKVRASVRSSQELYEAVQMLLCQTPAKEGQVCDGDAPWSFRIGGGADEA